jgi:hypothetical protein
MLYSQKPLLRRRLPGKETLLLQPGMLPKVSDVQFSAEELTFFAIVFMLQTARLLIFFMKKKFFLARFMLYPNE